MLEFLEALEFLLVVLGFLLQEVLDFLLVALTVPIQ